MADKRLYCTRATIARCGGVPLTYDGFFTRQILHCRLVRRSGRCYYDLVYEFPDVLRPDDFIV